MNPVTPAAALLVGLLALVLLWAAVRYDRRRADELERRIAEEESDA